MDNPALIFTADAHEAGSVVDIVGIDMKPTSIKIRVVGKDSKTFRRIEDAAALAYLESKGKSETGVAERMAAMTLSWENVPDPREETYGEPLAFNKDNAKLFYEKAPFVLEQVNRFINDRANFMQDSNDA